MVFLTVFFRVIADGAAASVALTAPGMEASSSAAGAAAGEVVAGAAASASQSRAASSRPSVIETCARKICDWLVF